MYACLTTDLIASKTSPDRADVQARVEAALEQVNRDHRADLTVPLGLTLGDEWQGLMPDLAAAFRIDFAVRRRLHPLQVRSAIGVGELSTPIRDRTAQMDGSCFHRSRRAMDRAKKRKGSSNVVDTGIAWLNDHLNAQEAVVLALWDDWTDRQFETVMTFLDHGTEPEAARVLGVAQPTVHKSLRGAHGKLVLRALDARDTFLTQLQKTLEFPAPEDR